MASSLESVLASIPGYGGFAAKKRMNEQDERADFGQAVTLAQLANQIKNRQGDEAHRAAVLEAGTKDREVQRAIQRQAANDSFNARMQQIDLGYAQLADRAKTEAEKLALAERMRLDKAEAHAQREETMRLLGDIRTNTSTAVTPVTIMRDGKAIVIDGRSGRVLGDAVKETPEQQRAMKMRGLGDAIQEAEDILTGVKRDDQGNVTRGSMPTQSVIGAGVDAAASLFGATPEGAVEAQRLKVVAGVLTSKVPRMEGPQSNYDVQLYKQAAAEVGDDMKPVARRLEALRTMKRLYSKYERLQDGSAPAATPTPTPAPASPRGLQEGQKGTSRSGRPMTVRGGQWTYD